MFKLVLVMRSTTAHFFATFSLFLLEPFLEEISGLEAYWELLCLWVGPFYRNANNTKIQANRASKCK